ncbi:MAG: hypothetical protein RLZZ324_30 [Candidatus Parcubacteria bacterium]|jgi:predicted transcriptional regulator
MDFHFKQFRLDERGLGVVLGSLEADIMEAAWKLGDASVRDVLEEMSAAAGARGTRATKDKKAYSFNTIMTVMNRLVAKKLLAKTQKDGAFSYRASMDRDAFSRQVSRSVAEALVAGGSLFQASAFVEALKERSEDDLRKLKEIVSKE